MKISTSQSPTPEEPNNNAAKETEPRQWPLPSYEDDLVARVRAARAEAERKMQEFGHPSEYVITKIQGQRTDLNYDGDEVTALDKTETGRNGKLPSDEEA